MSDIKCDKCGGLTSTKQIVSRKTGKQLLVYECESGCKKGPYKYSFFPARENKASETVSKPTILQPTQLNATEILDEIRCILLLINSKLPAIKKAENENSSMRPMREDEKSLMLPTGEDENIPF